jgi:[protein-PII] uridylyltransferase
VSATPTRSSRSRASGPQGLDTVRAGVLRQPGLVGEPLRHALADAYDAWLRALPAAHRLGDGTALVAVGGLGRRESAPYSDVDLLLIHSGRADEVAKLADAFWYPIWDSKVGLDHAVRTPDQAVGVAKDDVKAMLSLLAIRHIAGDSGVSGPLRDRLFDLWRSTAPKRVPELHDICRARWRVAGEAAFLLEPNLKDARGGLRDAQILHALAAAQLVDYPHQVRAAYSVLLDVRAELHRRLHRDEDVLRQQEQPGLAREFDLGSSDALLRQVNEAARTIGLALDLAWRRVETRRRASRALSPRRWLAGSFGGVPQNRTPLAKDVVDQDGEVVLALAADPWADPVLVLRAARAAAENDLPLAPFALERLATESGPLSQPWPVEASDEFVALLSHGRQAVPVLESLDQAGLLVRLIPEWAAVRFAAQHNPVHRWTVDRHLLETAAQASELLRQVTRPDLLLIGSLLHDIGKGYPGADHSVSGAIIAEKIANRMGLSYGDTATVTALVRHHLLLPNTATRRDLADPMTISSVADAVAGSVELLELLHALTIADALATGPTVWSDWKAGLVADLVRRVGAVLGGGQLPAATALDDRRRRLAEAGTLAVEIVGDEVVVAAPDSLGVLSRAAGVLALHSLDVRSASIHTYAGMAVNAFVVEPRFGTAPGAAILRNDLARSLEGSLPLAERLSAKERAYARSDLADRPPPAVHWLDDAATDATVLELRTADSIGLLYRVTSTLEHCGVDIRSARVSSLGGSVVDAFYVTDTDGRPVASASRKKIEAALQRV